jgi:hypothetical protein
MEPPAVILERRHQRIQVPPESHTRRRQGSLGLPDPLDQHLQVVHAAEHVLAALQRFQVGAALCTCQFSRQFNAVPQFLHRDADGMQTLRQVHCAGIGDRRRQPRGAACHLRVHRQAPGACRRSGRRGFGHPKLLANPVELVSEAPQTLDRQPRGHSLTGVVAILRDANADPPDGAAPPAAGNMQLVDQQQQHVQLAHGAQPGRDFSQPTAELVSLGAVELEHRKQLAKAARGDPDAMERARVAVLHGIQIPRELVNALLQDFGSCARNGHDSGGPSFPL